MRQGSEVGAAGADQVTEASGKWRASATTGWHAAHIPGSVNVPTHDIPVAGAELPRGTALAVHCGHDYRATLGASLLERAGYHQLVVDDGWEGWSPRDHDAL
jgi:rhodanese-related sulfurtransferase